MGDDAPKKGSLPPDAELPRGASLGRYTVIRRIGVGGMGVVYLAFDPELDRRVAVKLLRARTAALEGSDGEARLLREAQVMAKLSHPNVITVFDVGTIGGDVFVAMEYVSGQTLREHWSAPGRDARAIVATCVQAGRGLAAAHRQGILHRDFKPENVLVDAQGRARVLDFGLARAGVPAEATGRFELDDTLVGKRAALAAAAPPITLLGTVLGTPAYMPPEQLRGAPIDARSDQFAFAIVTWEALFGERPFAGETIGEVLEAMESGRVRPPKKRGVLRGVVPALTRALSRKPEERWRSMDELLDALEGAAGSERRRTGVLAAVLAVVSGVAIAVAARGSRGPTCAGQDAALAGVWDASARDAVSAAFRATNEPNADAMLGRVTKALDEYAAGWTAASTDACVATRVRGTQSDEALDLRDGCLRARLDDVRALAELLRKADAQLVDNAYGAVLRLRPVAACADVASLRASAFAPPKDAVEAREVDRFRRDVADVVARFNAGKCEDAVPMAKRLVVPHPWSFSPAEADAFYAAARVEQACGDAGTSADWAMRAVDLAEQSHQDELVARALTLLAQVEGSGLSRYDEGMDVARLAEGTIRRIGSPEALLADLARARGWIDYTHGRLEAALPLRREALERHLRAQGDGDPDALQMRAELADLAYEAGQLQEALAAERDLLHRSIDLLGPGHVRTGRYTLDVAESLIAQGKYDEAAPWLDRAKPLVRGGSADHFLYVDAVERFGLGQVDAGDAAMRAYVAKAEKDFGADDPEPLSTRADLAKWLVLHGRTREALDVAQPLVARLHELHDPSIAWYANAYGATALALARSGRAGEGIAPADRAVELAEHAAAQLPFALLARAEVAIATGDAPRAAALVDRAKKLVDARGGIDARIAADLDALAARASR